MSGPPRPRLYRGGRLLLPEAAPPGVDALAVADGRILAVGTEDSCRAALPGRPEVVDLRGRALAPGFVDAHLHPLIMCVFEQCLTFDGCRGVGDVLDLVVDRARADREADGAIVGFRLDEALLAERRLPTADELEAAAPGREVVLVRRDGHQAVASRSAFAAAGLAAGGSDPPGGHVERDGTGRPTGLAREAAVAPLLALLPEVSSEVLRSGAAAWSARLLREGVTAVSAICQVGPEGPSGPAGALEAFGWSALVEDLPFDVQTILVAPEVGAVDEWRGTVLHDPSARRRVDAVKLFLDGTLGGATACMHDPFRDRCEGRGMRTMSDADAYARMVDAHLAGLQVCVHAIGDRANRSAADLFDRLLREHPGEHRHRVEHASVLDHRTVELYARHAITAVVQPINLRSERHWLADRVGPERLARTYPFRSLLDAGVPVAGSSDAPIEQTDVLSAMDAAVHRGGLADEQAVSPAEALAMYTTGGAAARRTDGDLGRLRPGGRADLVVLDRDPATAPSTSANRVLATTIGGADVYVHPDFAASRQGDDRCT